MNIARSAITHCSPIRTRLYDEIVHSCPKTVFAPISTTPSWLRIFVPSPIQAKRPKRISAPFAICSCSPLPKKTGPSVFQRQPAGVSSRRHAYRHCGGRTGGRGTRRRF
jgi:hypothetical protein